MPFTLVCFHAHPDDEALLTAGVMARAAAQGHRVVLVVATRGEVGQVAGDLLGAGEGLDQRRWAELEASARILGVARVEWLGYHDSGSAPAEGRALPAGSFAGADVDEAARRLADLLVEESADVLTTYDPNGGYGHPDHVQVHAVGARAAALAGTRVVLEATINRELMRTGLELADSLGFEVPADFTPDTFDHWYTETDQLTHAVDVTAQLDAKRAAMEAHASQATSADGTTTRSLAAFLTLPPEYFALAFGTEWFVDRSRPAGIAADDVFASLGEQG